MTVRVVELAPGITIGDRGFPFVAGPCVIESEEHCLGIARELRAMAHRLGVPLIFKASFDKANRSSIKSSRGPGLEDGLRILQEVKRETGLPLLTDVHHPDQCEATAEVCDVLQIPAFLCRQTDLVVEAARTGRPLNIKKGQFLAPVEIVRVAEKAASAGNDQVVATERGASFGYQNLVVDMRSFTMIHDAGIPVIFDVTHSLQLPGAGASGTAGDRRFAEPLARAAVAAGADGLFLEVHPDPENAFSDAATQLPPDRAEALMRQAVSIRRTLEASVPLV